MPSLPILVYFLFHPQSASARRLACYLHGQLNDDVIVPGLRIPTAFCKLGSNGAPRAPLSMNLAECNFIVPLADDEMCIDERWCSFVAETWLACQDTQHRCVPFQLAMNAWPLDERLQEVNFGRAIGQPEGSERDAWVSHRLVVELCRFLRGLDTTDDQSKAPTKLFVSHAKADMSRSPRVAPAIIDYLKADQPVEAWVDSGDIETGSRFSEEIASGVKRTSLLAILTDNYSSREWCREEIMLAKEHQRPIAVVDALDSHEVRSFPYLENVPKIHWNGDPAACIDLLLKETLRHLHAHAVLNQCKQPGDFVFIRPPEPATVLGLDPGATVLYCDPPLGAGETKRLAKSKVKLTTPLLRSAGERSLEGKLISLSMSESPDIAECGFDPAHLQQTVLEISRHLMIRGASLAYGGHIGPESYTTRLFELVRTHNSQSGVQPFQRIVNHRGWPLPKLPLQQRAALNAVSTIIPIGRPADIDERMHPQFVQEPAVFFPSETSAEHRYAWCRGMTEMRRFQTDRERSSVLARIVLGGAFGPTLKTFEGQAAREQWYMGRMPGVLEEVLLSIQAGQPVFLIGAFGGAAKMTAELLQGLRRLAASWDYQSRAPHAEATRQLYASRRQSWWYYDNEPRINDLPNDDVRSIVEFLADAWKPRTEKGWETHLNPLSRSENLELFESIDAMRIVELVHSGISASM